MGSRGSREGRRFGIMSDVYLKHLRRTALARIAMTSFLDCHVRGLHSLMLADVPGGVVRMFVATSDHDMYRNTPGNGPLSIAFHTHDAELTLHVLRGGIGNVTPTADGTNGRCVLKRFRYDSRIKGGAGGFVKVYNNEPGQATALRYKWLREGDALYLPADTYHSVAVPFTQFAAWMVYEGAKDPNYDPLVYSDDDLTTFSSEGLYRRPTQKQVADLLDLVLES